MNYLAHRFSNTASLVALLALSIGTAWLFSFAVRINSEVDVIFNENARAIESVSVAHASSTVR